MARAGTKVVVVVAVSFVSDHLETLHEIDIRYRRQVAGLGMRLVRAPALGTSTAFIDALADLCQDRLAKDRQRDGRAGQSRPLDGRGADGRPAESPPGMAPPDGKQGSRA
jgi:hypothetical protein